MIVPLLKLRVTSSSSSRCALGERGPLSSRGSRPKLSRRDISHPCMEFARSLLRLHRPQRVADAEQDPGKGGHVPLGLAGTRGGGVSEGCPDQAPHPPSRPRLGEGPVRISRERPILGGNSSREPEKDNDSTAVGTPFFSPAGSKP